MKTSITILLALTLSYLFTYSAQSQEVGIAIQDKLEVKAYCSSDDVFGTTAQQPYREIILSFEERGTFKSDLLYKSQDFSGFTITAILREGWSYYDSLLDFLSGRQLQINYYSLRKGSIETSGDLESRLKIGNSKVFCTLLDPSKY